MGIVPLSSSDDYAEGVHGVPWEHIWRMRRAVCRRWFYRCNERIPIEEFYSEANEAIAYATLHYDPTVGAQFPTYLYGVMSRHMGQVPRAEYRGLVYRCWDKTQRRYVAGTEQYPTADRFAPVEPRTGRLADAEPGEPIPVPLTQPASQEASTLLREVVAHIQTRVTPRNQRFLWRSAEGCDTAEVVVGTTTTPNAAWQAVRKLRHRLTAWSEEVSLAAAD